jgi:predicted DNA-binding transcriptional regulator YafY
MYGAKMVAVRAGRLLSLLMLLENRGRMTASDLAEELEVSVRTILRDVETLSGAGVPVYSVRGPFGGFELLGEGPKRLRSLAPWSDGGASSGSRRVELRISDEGRRLAGILGWGPLATARGLRDPADSWEHVVLRSSHLEILARQLLALGGEVEVVGPGTLRSAVHRTALAAAALHPPPS